MHALYLRVGRYRAEPTPIRSPVAGQWKAMNGPADRVPSHGLHGNGQTYAMDLVYTPEGAPSQATAGGAVMRPPEEFPGFGQPVLAVADGVVARGHDRERDHRSRSGVLGLAHLVVEMTLRELTGPNRILGNSVVVRLGDRTYALVAHLRSGSVRVRPGDRVVAGQQIAECGNSGNSTEPHVHVQLMDHPRAWLAAGLPFRFTDVEIVGGEGRPEDAALPRNGQTFVAASRRAAGADSG